MNMHIKDSGKAWSLPPPFSSLLFLRMERERERVAIWVGRGCATRKEKSERKST